MLEAALRATGEADSRERALLLATLATELSFTDDPEQRRRLSDEAVETARRVGDRAALAYVLTTRFGAIWLPETLEERLANTAEAVRLADELGDPWAQFQAVHWHFMGLVQAGRFEGTASLLERLEALAQRMGDPTTRWITAYDRATVAIVAGRLDAAEELANEALALATDSGPANPLPLFVSQLTAIRYEQGRLAELQPLMAKAVSESPGIPGLRAFLALSYVEADLHDKARELLATEAETDFAEVPRGTTWLLALTIYGHVAADLGDRPTAASLYERLAPFHEQVAYAGVTAWCFVDHVLGRLATVLGKFEDAERHLEKALDRSIRTGAPLWTARAQLDTARMLLARDAPGDRGRAVEPLEEAIAWAGRVGAATVERRARSLRDHRQAMDAAAEAGPTGQRLRIGGRPSPDAEAPDQDEEATESTGRLERKGDFWLLRLAEAEVRLRDGKGVRYLARLLADPGVELHAADLQQGYADAAPATTTGSAVEAGLSVRGGGTEDAGDVLDAEAKRSYRARIDELREEIEEAEDFNDPERAAKAREELEFIGRELAGAVGIGGRDRKAASQAERARVNVTRAIRATIRRVADNDERLGRHLEMSVRTGSFCSYQPDPGHAVEWRIAEGST